MRRKQFLLEIPYLEYNNTLMIYSNIEILFQLFYYGKKNSDTLEVHHKSHDPDEHDNEAFSCQLILDCLY